MKSDKRKYSMNSIIATLLLVLASGTLLLTSCAGKSMDMEAGEYGMVTETAAAMSFDSAAMKNEVSMEKYEASAASGNASGNTSEALPENLGRKLIRTVNLTVETDAFDELLQALNDQISSVSGYVEQSSTSGNSMYSSNQARTRRASLTVRIPADQLDEFVSRVADGGNVTNKSETTEDVTLQYTDLESRKKTLSMEQDRIWALLEKADTLEAVIALEERLSEIRYQLESLESRLRLYDNQVDYSTVYLEIREVKNFTPTAPKTIPERIRDEFAVNMEEMGILLTDLLIMVIAGLPIWLPTVLVILLLAFLMRKLLRKLKKKRSEKKIAPVVPAENKTEEKSDTK